MSIQSVAASLGAGQWGEFATDGDASGYATNGSTGKFTLGGASSGGCMGFARKALYFSEGNKRWIIFWGTNHYSSGPSDPNFNACFMVYDAAAHQFNFLTPGSQSVSGTWSHTYGLLAINPATRQMWRMPSNLADVRVLDLRPGIASISSLAGDTNWSDFTNPSLGSGANRGTLEFFPEKNWLLFHDALGGILKRWALVNGSSWVNVTTGDVSADGTFCIYNPTKAGVLMGGGFDGSSYRRELYWLNSSGTRTQISNLPFDCYTDENSIVTLDPVSGKYLFLVNSTITDRNSAVAFWEGEINTGTPDISFTQRTDLEAGIPLLGYVSTEKLANCVCASLYDQGVIAFFSARDGAGNGKARIYKHTANTWASSGLTGSQKAAAGGVVKHRPFSAQSEIGDGYSWPTPEMDSYTLFSGLTNRTISTSRGSSEARVFGFTQVDGTDTVPQVVNGRWKTVCPSGCTHQPGYFIDNFDGNLGTPNFYISPTSDNGSVIYVGFNFRANAALLNTAFRHIRDIGSQGFFFATTPGAGSFQVDATGTPPPFDSSMIGEYFTVYRPFSFYGGTNWTAGSYLIASVPSSSRLMLDSGGSSPTPSGAGGGSPICSVSSVNGGSGYADESVFKIAIVGGNAPNGNVTSFYQSLVLQLFFKSVTGTAFNYPNMYTGNGTIYAGAAAQYGSSSLLNTTKRVTADVTHEIMIRMHIIGTSGDTTSRATLWIDRDMCSDWDKWPCSWGGAVSDIGDGLGQTQLTIYQTRKDPTLAHSEGTAEYSDFIVSRQPIPSGALPEQRRITAFQMRHA